MASLAFGGLVIIIGSALVSTYMINVLFDTLKSYPMLFCFGLCDMGHFRLRLALVQLTRNGLSLICVAASPLLC